MHCRSTGVLGAPGRKGIQRELRGGRLKSKLEVVGDVPKSKTGTTIRFWPDPQSSIRIIRDPRLKQVLRAKAVLCPNLRVTLATSSPVNARMVLYGRVASIPGGGAGKGEWLPAETFYGKRDIEGGSLDWAFAWVLESSTASRELCQSDSHGGGRHARQRLAVGAATRCVSSAIQKPGSTRVEVDARGRLGRRELRALDENARAAVRGKQREALVARIGRDRAGRDQGRLRPLAQSGIPIRARKSPCWRSPMRSSGSGQPENRA